MKYILILFMLFGTEKAQDSLRFDDNSMYNFGATEGSISFSNNGDIYIWKAIHFRY